MFKFKALLCLLLAGVAHFSFAADMKMRNLNFVAPIVQDHSSLPGDTQFGSIVYDNNAGLFMGLAASGTWQAFGGGANTALSNLASTAVNANITPASNNSVDLGASSLQYSNVYANHGVFEGGQVYTATVVQGHGIYSHAFSDPGAPRALYLDIHSIDSNEPSQIQLGSSDGTNIEITSYNGPGVIETPNHIRTFPNVQYSAPSGTVQSGAGSTGTCVVSTATDVAGSISITTSGTGISTGDMCNISFGQSYANVPKCMLIATNADASAQQTYVTTSTSGLSINFNIAGTSSTTYTFNYFCIEMGAR